MQIIDHATHPVEWRGRDKNIEHRTLVDCSQGAKSMSLWEVFPPKGAGTPPHVHPHEETITVIAGRIKAWVDGEIQVLGERQTLFIPAGAKHQFGVISEEPAHLLIAFPVSEPTCNG